MGAPVGVFAPVTCRPTRSDCAGAHPTGTRGHGVGHRAERAFSAAAQSRCRHSCRGDPGRHRLLERWSSRRLDCAQCHNHPYETWSQDQFWGLAAFFGRMFKMGDTGDEYVIFDHPLDEEMGNADVDGSIKIYHPRTKVELTPTLLDGTKIQ